MDRTHAYQTCLRTGFAFATIVFILFCSMLYRSNLTLLCVASALLGLGVIPLLPIVTESCAESTYPLSEDLSVGILLIGGNLSAVGFTFIMQALIELPALGALLCYSALYSFVLSFTAYFLVVKCLLPRCQVLTPSTNFVLTTLHLGPPPFNAASIFLITVIVCALASLSQYTRDYRRYVGVLVISYLTSDC